MKKMMSKFLPREDSGTSIIEITRPMFLDSPSQTWGKVIQHARDNSLMKKGNHEVSHCRLDGGVYCYDTDELLEKFYSMYSDDMTNGVKHFCHENRSEMFPLYFDLDILLHQRVDESKLMEWAEFIHGCVRAFLKPIIKYKADSAIVATTDFTTKDQYVKTGMHIHFPEIIVDLKYAIEITASVAYKLKEKYGAKAEELVHEWYPKVVDIAPLDRGIRMIGSRKAETCKECRGKRDTACSVVACVRGRLDLGRPYWPRWIIGNSGRKFLESCTETEPMVRLCSTRIKLTQQFPASDLNKKFLQRPRWWKQRTMLPEVIGEEMYSRHFGSGVGRIAKRKSAGISMATDASDDGSVMHGVVNGDSDANEFTKVDVMSPEFKIIKDFFDGADLSSYKKNRAFHVLRDGEVTGVSKNKASTMFCVWTSSKECRNLIPKPDGKPRYHNGRGVWIKISKSGIEWRCHCKCDTKENRIDGIPCAEPGRWSRSSNAEFQQLKHLPGQLCGLFGNDREIYKKVRQMIADNKSGVRKSTAYERMKLLEPVIERNAAGQVALIQERARKEKELLEKRWGML